MLSRQKQAEYKEIRAQKNYPQARVEKIADQAYSINGQTFHVVSEYKDAIDVAAIADRYMDVFDSYDFIVGDWSFEQLRLKGFYRDDVNRVSHDKYISHLTDYLIEYCSFGCAYFVLAHERTELEREQRNNKLSQPSRSNSQRSRRTNTKRTKNTRQQTTKKPTTTQKDNRFKQTKASNPPATERGKKRRTEHSNKGKQFQIYDKKEESNRHPNNNSKPATTVKTTKTITTKNGVKSQIRIRKKEDN